MSEETLTQEGDNAFAEKETPQDSSPETTITEETPSSEGEHTQDAPPQEDKLPPFHEHPRFQELIKQKSELEEKVSELSSFREKAEPLLSRFNPQEEVQIPSWFGGDEAAYRAYQADQAQVLEQATQKAVKAMEERTDKEQQQIKAANEYFESSIADIESQGHKVDRNKLLKFVADNELVDTQGRWAYKKGYEFMQALE